MPSDGTDPLVALISLAQAKTALKIASGTVADDAVIVEMINRASVLAANVCGRKLISKDYTEYYHGRGGDTLMLKNWPVVSVASIYDDPLREWAAATAINLTRDALIDLESGIVKLWNQAVFFLHGKGNIRAIYTAGYAGPAATTPTVPYDLAEAVAMIVQAQYRRNYADQRIGLQSETIGDRTFTYSEEAIPKKAALILKRYRVAPSPNFSHAG